MEYITVYEIEKIFFPYYSFIPLILLALFGVLYYKLLTLHIKNILCVVLPVSILFMLFLCIANVYGFVNIKTNIVEPYFNGEYLTVEGNVANFKPLASHGKGTESFEVNGIKFNYSKTSVEYIGYNKVSNEGGYIKRNNQKVRIRYIYDKTYDTNLILKLEISNNSGDSSLRSEEKQTIEA